MQMLKKESGEDMSFGILGMQQSDLLQGRIGHSKYH